MNDSFKIIGADGREYGPVTLDELRAWVGDSRVARQTLVRRLSEDQWSRADALPELADLLTTMPELPGDGEADELRPAGFWIRFAAHWPDQFLIAAAVIACIGLPGTPGTEPKFAELVAWTQKA
ncbi:MAG: DUF4339 domain-containing protein [Verrucomicrobia bacterium]|nr:DUF4339 domain-containing protein [Verrucomicrobiota bacterium]